MAKNKSFIHVQCYFIIAPDDFQLLENTQGAHVAGFYSPQDGEILIQSMKRRRGFDLLSSPSMTLRQGKSGRLEVVQEFIYPTEYKPASIKKDVDFSSFPVTPSTPSSFETTNLGLTAEFQGRRSKAGDIEFSVELERRTFEGFVNYGTPIQTTARTAFGKPVDVTLSENSILMPVIHTKRMDTTVSIADGHFLAIGGLRHLPSEALRKNLQKHNLPTPQKDGNLLVLLKIKAVDSNGN